jgi:hypothetical protein
MHLALAVSMAFLIAAEQNHDFNPIPDCRAKEIKYMKRLAQGPLSLYPFSINC